MRESDFRLELGVCRSLFIMLARIMLSTGISTDSLAIHFHSVGNDDRRHPKSAFYPEETIGKELLDDSPLLLNFGHQYILLSFRPFKFVPTDQT